MARVPGAHVAYYTFQNTQGKLSEPCYWHQTVCSTDWSRPAFMQKGNTLFYLRDLIPSTPGEAGSMSQYLGLASKFNLLDLNLNWKGRVGNGLGLMVSGNYIRNLAYSASRIEDHVGCSLVADNVEEDGFIRSGGNAWMIHAALGKDYRVADRGDWQVFAGYKYIQPDAVPDAYNDSTFHLGGTNARGYCLGAAYAIEKNVMGQLRATSQQLQRLQSEQAQANAAKAAAESQRDAAQAEAAQLRKALGKQLAARDHELQVCMLKNDQLYSAGKEILSAYESFSTGELMALRQPFSAGTRVAFDMKAQELGDKLYEHKFDRQAVDTPAVAP